MTARILITGSRQFSDGQIMQDAIGKTLLHLSDTALKGVVTLVHGTARGADQLADALAPTLGLTVERWPADWDRLGSKAGTHRNQLMVDAGADVCLAFRVDGLPCTGTRDCASRAARAGIPVNWFVQKDVPVRKLRTVRGL